jgi:DNA replication protein DnaC
MTTTIAEVLTKLQNLNQLQKEKLVGSTDPSDIKYECPKCKDLEGFIVRLEDRTDIWRYCECYEKKLLAKRVERIFKTSQITEEFKKLSFQNFNLLGRPSLVQDAFNCAEAYLESFENIRGERQNSIALLGQPGSGKTHLLISIANALLDKGVGVIYFPWVEGLNDLKDDFSKVNEKVQQLKEVDILFIDDIFKGRREPTDWQKESLFEIVNYRYLNHLPMLISSERDIDQICDADEGIGSRIYQMSKDFTVVLRGEKNLNFRLEEAI